MWQTEMVRLVRFMIGDINEPYKYSDERLQELIVVAAQLTKSAIPFTKEYIIDSDDLELLPDPTDTEGGTRDDSFVNLVVLQAACILDQSEARSAAARGIAIRDGSSSIDLRANVQARLEILKVGWCANFAKAKYEYYSNSLSAGKGIVGPFREYMDYIHNYELVIDRRYR
jgi:hypothetical protein